MQAVTAIQKNSEIDQVTAEESAIAYLEHVFSFPCQLGKSRRMTNGNWQFLVLCNIPHVQHLLTIATLQVDGKSGQVIPFTEREQQAASERILIAQARIQNQLPLQNDTIPQLFAHHQANIYLSQTVGFFFTAVEAVFIPVDGPVWQFLIEFRLPDSGNLGILGTLDVDATSGEVIPLSSQQITKIQRRANAIARYQTQSAAA